MTRDLRITMLITWNLEEGWYLLESVKRRTKSARLLQPASALPFIKGNFWRRFVERFPELVLPFIALKTGRRCDVVFSWSMRIGVCYGILRRLFYFVPTSKHILRDFHINLERNDWLFRMKLGLLRLALPGIDFLMCTSRKEERIYAEMFGLPPERIRFFPEAPPQAFLKWPAGAMGDYLFSYGNSDRDFDTLVEAVRTLDFPVVLLSQKYRPEKPLPSHVRLIAEKVEEKKLIEIGASSRMIVLTLRDGVTAAGQNVMLEAMAMGKPLIVSANPATQEYAIHGETALFCDAGDPSHLRQRIERLLQNPKEAERIGMSARESVAAYPDMQVDAFLDVVKLVAAHRAPVSESKEI